MKRVLAILLLAAMVLCAGCRKVPQTYTYEHSGIALTVNTEEKTINDGKYIYRYAVDENHNITITYPDGAVYPSATDIGEIIIVGENEKADTNSLYRTGSSYLAGWVLMSSLEKTAGKNTTFHLGYFLLGLFAIAVGLPGALDPERAIRWRSLWWFKDAEPTEFSLLSMKFGGVLSVIIGVILLVLSFCKL